MKVNGANFMKAQQYINYSIKASIIWAKVVLVNYMVILYD